MDNPLRQNATINDVVKLQISKLISTMYSEIMYEYDLASIPTWYQRAKPDMTPTLSFMYKWISSKINKKEIPNKDLGFLCELDADFIEKIYHKFHYVILLIQKLVGTNVVFIRIQKKTVKDNSKNLTLYKTDIYTEEEMLQLLEAKRMTHNTNKLNINYLQKFKKYPLSDTIFQIFGNFFSKERPKSLRAVQKK